MDKNQLANDKVTCYICNKKLKRASLMNHSMSKKHMKNYDILLNKMKPCEHCHEKTIGNKVRPETGSAILCLSCYYPAKFKNSKIN